VLGWRIISYMWDIRFSDVRRTQARVPLERLCSVLARDREEPALLVDLAESGLRLQRPPTGMLRGRIVQIEFEIPGYDDLLWASGEVCFDQLWPISAGSAGRPRLVRASGIRLIAGARRHLSLVRDYVMETRRALASAGVLPDRRRPNREHVEMLGLTDWASRSSAFLRG